MMTPNERAGLVDVDQNESERVFEDRVHRYLQLSGAEFRRAVANGEQLPDHPMVGHLLLHLGARRRSN
jgi:hypothetical protein